QRGKDRKRTVPLVFMVSAYRRMLRRHRWQIRGRILNGLHSRLFVNGYSDYRGCQRSTGRRRSVLQHHFLIDQQHLSHLALKLWIAPFQVILHFMRLQLLLLENPLHRGFGSTRQAGMSGANRVLTHMSRQGSARPQFGGIAQVFGLGASQMHHPRFIGCGNDRLLGTMKGVFEPSLHSHLQSLMQAMVNRDSADVQGTLDSRRIVTPLVVQKNPRPFDFAERCRARGTQSYKSLLFLCAKDQSWKFGFPGHALNLTPPTLSVNVLTKRCTSTTVFTLVASNMTGITSN